MVEPRDIKTEFFEIAKLLKEASFCLDILTFGTQAIPAKKIN